VLPRRKRISVAVTPPGPPPAATNFWPFGHIRRPPPHTHRAGLYFKDFLKRLCLCSLKKKKLRLAFEMAFEL
jgi:hypothetical protein